MMGSPWEIALWVLAGLFGSIAGVGVGLMVGELLADRWHEYRSRAARRRTYRIESQDVVQILRQRGRQ